MATHTPGPWHADKSLMDTWFITTRFAACDEDDRTICLVATTRDRTKTDGNRRTTVTHNRKHADADAALIAAAPDMLAALKEALRALEFMSDDPNPASNSPRGLVMAAIAKAAGQP